MSQIPPPPIPKLCTNCVRKANLGLVILAAFLLVGLMLSLVSVVPRFETIFKDMGQKLPMLTQLIMFSTCWPGVILTIGIFGVLAATMIVGYSVLPAPAGNIVNAVVLVIVLCLAALLVVGLFAPLFALIQGIQGRG
jgi:hypothetical protein